jgi:chaperonin GroES
MKKSTDTKDLGMSGGNIVPLGDRVLIKPLSEDELAVKNAAGIIIPETIDKEKPMQGRVIAVGEGRMTDEGKLVQVRIRPGSRVVFSKYSPDEIKIDGEEYYILSESSVLAVIN